ncbi:hypothetical protein B2K_39175 [Paenibacillus mucilaginosus K02]|uniref:Uncharacterized protein n=1 Tax=Paenibacillus mucilaginosus K02 TaxID=997761 RepID=R9ULD6_9BACL|nr:hypothetical protein B2K_39175 [Paenibacillus mucilaginosus K02]
MSQTSAIRYLQFEPEGTRFSLRFRWPIPNVRFKIAEARYLIEGFFVISRNIAELIELV